MGIVDMTSWLAGVFTGRICRAVCLLSRMVFRICVLHGAFPMVSLSLLLFLGLVVIGSWEQGEDASNSR